MIRNALGVLRDVSEYWSGEEQPRFHYQYAVFTDTKFTLPAQKFGYVQDIFLLPLARATSMAPVLGALKALRAEHVPQVRGPAALQRLRRKFLTSLREAEPATLDIGFLEPLIDAANQIRQALIGMTLNGLPLFLVPAAHIDVSTLQDQPSPDQMGRGILVLGRSAEPPPVHV